MLKLCQPLNYPHIDVNKTCSEHLKNDFHQDFGLGYVILDPFTVMLLCSRAPPTPSSSPNAYSGCGDRYDCVSGKTLGEGASTSADGPRSSVSKIGPRAGIAWLYCVITPLALISSSAQRLVRYRGHPLLNRLRQMDTKMCVRTSL